MSTEETINLEEVSQKFRHWRAQHNRGPYPSALWDAAFALAQKMPIRKVADCIGVERAYLKRKMRRAKSESKSSFVEVIPEDNLKNKKCIEIRISREFGTSIAMQFEGTIDDAVPIIRQLFCEGVR
jgi:hypothetical protein